ncbi:MAG: prohibitin family protein [Candidatus Magasanikbacteria bacterium]|nr:prohibitin family protein [Candidatus Magasanikbacteria bacterium]MCA9391448.1 prohibitin family protein [Candidatus Magasanikbacteria bacterium]
MSIHMSTPKIIAWVVGGLLAVILFFSLIPFGMIPAGSRGVMLRFGAVTGRVVSEGLYFRMPIVESVAVMDVRLQKEQVEATAASKDLQSVQSTVAANFHIKPEMVVAMYRDVGPEYKVRIIDPALQETVKATTAKFTAEELVTRREEVREEMKSLLQTKLTPRGIEIDDFNIVNFDFSESFNAAIEAKVTAEQAALTARNRLEQVKFEAEQRIAEARGKAEALRVESEAIKSSPAVLELRAIEKWDGKLPSVMGSGATPFVNIGSISR